MAGENQNIDNKDFKNTLKDIIRDQQDLSGVVKDILRDLNKSEQLYTKIEASINRISKGSVDVKGVQRELNKLIDREYITNKANEELQKRIIKEGKSQSLDLLKTAKEEARLSVEQGIALGKKRDYNKELLAYLEASEDHGALELFYAEKALELAKQKREEAEVLLETEKKLQKSLGVEGKLLKNFADKLGIGAEFYQEMSEYARKLNEDGKQFGFGDKLALLAKVAKESFMEAAKSPLTYIALAYTGIKNGLNNIGNLAKQSMTALTGSGGPLASFIAPISNLISKIPLVGGLIGGILDIFANTVDFATAATSETQKFARSMGMSFKEAKRVETSMAAFAESSGKAFLNVKKMREEQMKLSESLGINRIINNQILADSIQLKEQFGLQEDSAVELARVSIITGKTQTQLFKTFLGQTIALGKITGVAVKFQEVMKQASSFGGVLGLTFAKYPERLSKSLLVTKALGIDLQKLDSIASSFLDFESSISKEFEAQLFTGKDINLAKARELAMNNDLAGLAVEINKQLGTSEDFLKSNRFTQEALAEATGMTRDDIADMLKKQELFAKAGATDLKTFRERVSQMERAGTLQSDFLSKLTEEQKQNFLSSTSTERISNFVERIRQNFATLVSSPGFQNLINKVLTYLEDPNVVDNILKKVSGFFSYIVKIIAVMLDGLDSIPFVEIDAGLRRQLHSYSNYLGSGISLGTQAANNEAKSGYTGALGQATANSAAAGQPIFNVHFKGEVVDTPSNSQTRNSKGIYNEVTKVNQ